MKAPAIENLNASHLEVPLRSLAAPERARPVDWQVEKIKGGVGNPVSAGLYRASGRLRVNGETRDFSMVLKVIQSPARLGFINLGEGEDQQHWNYWRREPLFYQSELVQRLPPGIAIPACYHIQYWDEQTIWLWLEDVQDAGELRQPAELAYLARQLGRLNGKFTPPHSLPDASWLGRRTYAQFVHRRPNIGNALFAANHHPDWDHPFLQALFPIDHEYRRFWDEIEHFLALEDGLPPTWCHGDGAPTNFKLRQAPDGSIQLLALDWALTNIGVLGKDFAQIIYGCYDGFDASTWEDVQQILFESYLMGLREMGWQGDERPVRLGTALTVLIHYGIFLLTFIGFGMEGSDAIPQVTKQHMAAAQFIGKAARTALELDST